LQGTSSFVSSFGSMTSPIDTPPRYTTQHQHRHHHVGRSDRFIPSRATSSMNFSLWENRTRRHSTAVVSPDDSSETNNDNRNGTAIEEGSDPATSRSESTSSSQQPLLNELLRSELLGENMDPIASSNLTGRSTGVGSRNPLRESGNYFRFQSPREVELENVYSSNSGPESIINSFSLNPMGSASSHLLLSAPQKRTRRIQKVPFKVLDAPALQDDFYLNLVDWCVLFKFVFVYVNFFVNTKSHVLLFLFCTGHH
jgi:hypothetical protein